MESITDRMRQLLEMGGKVLSTRHNEGGLADIVDASLFYEWQAGALSFLQRVFGGEHVHFRKFEDNCKSSWYHEAVHGQSILKAAQADISGGYLRKLEQMVAADIFADFLDMAEYLNGQGYKDPAASLMGAVLEDGLRRIAQNHSVAVSPKEDIGSLNSKLAQAGVYNRLTQKRIQVWNDIRNNADHGKFGEYTGAVVGEMIGGVRDFLAGYP